MKQFTYILFLCVLAIPAKAQTVFGYTGKAEVYTVPPCVSSIIVDVKGAGGFSNTTSSLPGKGGRVQAVLNVTPGELLHVYVGGAGIAAAGGWNGGAGPGPGSGAGGGGASDIRRGGTGLSNRIIVAGGGGGTGACNINISHGGAGGGSTEGGNAFVCGGQGSAAAGKGGTMAAGGNAGSEVNPGLPGSLGNGGAGGGHFGGGGGGGYYGGGGGATNVCCWGGGGGGGSSYAEPFAENIVHSRGYQTGDGQIIITPGPSGGPMPGFITGPSSACEGTVTSYYVEAQPGAISYNWSFPAGTVITSGQGTTYVEVVIGNTPGNISVTATNSCGTGLPRKKAFTLADSVYAAVSPDTTICKGSSVSLLASGGITYSWSPPTGLSCTNCPDPIANPEATTEYTVITGSGSCVADTDTVMVNVIPCAGIPGQLSDRIVLYPNPADDLLAVRIYYSGLQQTEIELMNMQGRSLYKGIPEIKSGVYVHEADISAISPGLYYVRIRAGDSVFIKKLLIF